jgi:protein-S-isoprenylcysteine O-methyltransferase Ste14
MAVDTARQGPADAIKASAAKPTSPYRGSMLTGLGGVAACVIASYFLREWAESGWMKTLIVLGVGAVVMVAIEIFVFRAHLSPTTGLAERPVRAPNFVRIFHKLLGLWISIGALAGGYWLLSVYAEAMYDPFKAAALWLLPGIAVASPLYIAYVDVRQHEPVDAYAQLGMLIGGTIPDDWSGILLHARSWLVKGFFLPLMFTFCNNSLAGLWGRPAPDWSHLQTVFAFAIDGLYLIDVYIAVIAYALTLRLTDSHLRSVEPTLGGWVICLICYPPFTNGVGAAYLKYDADGLYWGRIFEPFPVLYAAWGALIILAVAIYALSTVVFGLRFSNLTNRGIVSTGPYRWSKHPAYISKNLSWWMISLPFVAGAGWQVALQSSLLLGIVNLIYYLRARTEERHLMADPAYREYAAFIARHGLFAKAGMLVGVGGRKSAQS